jgi:hypothetical protein
VFEAPPSLARIARALPAPADDDAFARIMLGRIVD